jgi:hypothetical protein
MHKQREHQSAGKVTHSFQTKGLNRKICVQPTLVLRGQVTHIESKNGIYTGHR